MASESTAHPYRLPGGKAAVETRRTQLRAMLGGALLFGPSYLRLIHAARSGDRGRLHDAERSWAKRAARAVNLTIETHGMHLIDAREQYVVAPLHEGFADVLALMRLPLDLAFSATQELFEWRLLGRYLAASGQSPVPIDDGAMAYRAIIRAAERAFQQQESVVLFPQGSILGIETAFHQGAFRLSARTGRPLLPIVLTGGATVWEYPYSPNLNLGQTLRLEVLAPVPAVEAVDFARDVETEMKERALQATPGPRRFVPERDGWWDDYRYEIDPNFPDLAERVRLHRAVAHR